MMVSAFLLPIPVCATVFFINFIAIYYHASRAIPFGTMVSTLSMKTGASAYRRLTQSHLDRLLQVAIACICLFVILPLTLVGTVLGRNLSGQIGRASCRERV